MSEPDPTVCPRCNGTALDRIDCGPDTYEDDITYTSLCCRGCGLWWDGWRELWLVGVESCFEEGGAVERKPPGGGA